MAPNVAQRRRPVSWQKDGVDGGPSSVDVILKWITAEGNLQRWRGDTVGGKTKKALASEIAELIKEAGITGRTYKGVLQKINEIQDSYNKAADLKRQSGEGILDEDAAKTFHDKLVAICKHWDILDPVFHNPRADIDGEGLEVDQPDFDFPFGDYGRARSEDDEGDSASEAKSSSVTVADERDSGRTSSLAKETICISTDTSSEESVNTATHPPTAQRVTGNSVGSNTGGSAPGKSKNEEKPRKAKKRSRIEMAQAKIKFTKDLLELGIYSTEEVKEMVAAQFEDN
ncbi:hypothetical protein DVH05_010823 [Phytophthora capsici]|nr:hypothetical protein DVH05_010823 [Phytophthora capsici]